MALGQLLDQQVTQKIRIIAQSPQPQRGVVEAVFVMRIEPARCNCLSGFVKPGDLRIIQLNYAGHGTAPASCG